MIFANGAIVKKIGLFSEIDPGEAHASVGLPQDPYEPTLFRDECFIAFVISHLRTE
jgi:hypothetical protein